MNTRGNLAAAVGSVILNCALAAMMSQGAQAATPASKYESPAAPVEVVVHADNDHGSGATAAQHCRSTLRTRALVAVLVAMIV